MKPAGNVQSKAFLYFQFFSPDSFSAICCQDSLVTEAAKSAAAVARAVEEDTAKAVEDHMDGEETKEEELPLEQDEVMDADWWPVRSRLKKRLRWRRPFLSSLNHF